VRNERVQQALGKRWDSFLGLAKECCPSIAALVCGRRLLVAAGQCILGFCFSLLVCGAVSCFPREAIEAVAKLCDICGCYETGERIFSLTPDRHGVTLACRRGYQSWFYVQKNEKIEEVNAVIERVYGPCSYEMAERNRFTAERLYLSHGDGYYWEREARLGVEIRAYCLLEKARLIYSDLGCHEEELSSVELQSFLLLGQHVSPEISAYTQAVKLVERFPHAHFSELELSLLLCEARDYGDKTDQQIFAKAIKRLYSGRVYYDRFHGVHEWQNAVTKIVVVGLAVILLSLLFQASVVVFCRRRFVSEIILSTDHSRVLELLKALTALELSLKNFDAADIYSKLALNLIETGRLSGFVELVRARLFVLNGLPGAGLIIHRLVSLIALLVLYTLTLVAYAV
jgi:hypothetical protein